MVHLAALLPELDVIQSRLIRIPDQVDVPVSQRVIAILDTPELQRLREISQLGLVALVYPGAVHSRFEHSLGVYRLGCLTLRHLLVSNADFAASVSESEQKIFLLAALLHDIGHWPFCHAIEDLRLPEFPKHESLARALICGPNIAEVIHTRWGVDPAEVANLIGATRDRNSYPSVLQNLLSGPVDIDKMDYLQRDSLHAGVPYGRNFDVGRLISSLCVGRDGHSIAITEKGKTAAEMMVFARYVMFSEVYWHHTVRSATSMLQRLIFELRGCCDCTEWLKQSEREFGEQLLALSVHKPHMQEMAQTLFGRQRGLYKQLAQFTLSGSPEIFEAVARRPYAALVHIGERLAEELSRSLPHPLVPADILIDAPPVKLEVQFKVDVRQSHGTEPFVALSKISPVVRSLATEQFDNFVKRIRIFISPKRAGDIKLGETELAEILLAVCQDSP